MAKKKKEVSDDTQELEVVASPAISDAEWERRTKLCVSDPEYINPSYDR